MTKLKNDYKSVLMLSYYKNNLVHLFINESYVACALNAFKGDWNEEEGISIQRVLASAFFLSQLLKQEFVSR
jgi:glycerone phosphate O-acyltransferase/fatty acyl-CoA reductase